MDHDTSFARGHRARLRERFLQSGLEAFAPHEVLELLLTLAIPRKDVKIPAKLLLQRFGSLKGVLDAPSEAVSGVPGIGSVAPIALRIVREAASLYTRETAELSQGVDDLPHLWGIRFGGLEKEVFEVAFLDPGGRVMKDGIERLTEGTVDRATVYPRTVMQAALRRNSSGVVLAHNHTNGDPAPSQKDELLTRALVLAGQTLDVKVLDHLIVGNSGVFSFADAGLL
jgi:DNA repair protein RadC